MFVEDYSYEEDMLVKVISFFGIYFDQFKLKKNFLRIVGSLQRDLEGFRRRNLKFYSQEQCLVIWWEFFLLLLQFSVQYIQDRMLEILLLFILKSESFYYSIDFLVGSDFYIVYF